MKFKARLFKFLNILANIFLIILFCALIFGIVTDCPNTAGYVYCPMEQ